VLFTKSSRAYKARSRVIASSVIFSHLFCKNATTSVSLVMVVLVNNDPSLESQPTMTSTSLWNAPCATSCDGGSGTNASSTVGVLVNKHIYKRIGNSEWPYMNLTRHQIRIQDQPHSRRHRQHWSTYPLVSPGDKIESWLHHATCSRYSSPPHQMQESSCSR
jgi:hypothetical protein